MSSETEGVLISQKKLKVMVGGLGIGLPTALFLGNYYLHGETHIYSSISNYYHSEMRDIFVGILFTIGVFMITYEGYGRLDRLLSDLGGSLSIIVALFPTTPTGEPKDTVGTIHLVAAGSFFLVLGIFCFFLFTKTNHAKPMTRKKKIRNLIYRICGLIMFVSIALLVLTETEIVDKPIDDSTFWLEYIANSAFGTAWLVKGEGIFILNDDPIMEMNPWELIGLIVLVILLTTSGLMLSLIFL